MTRRIFRAILSVALGVLLLALALMLGALYSHFTEVHYQQLRDEIALAAHAVERQGLDYFQDLEESMSSRITWIAADGTVLYDSRSDSQDMENHLRREEVQEALASGYGQSERYSGTLLERYLYGARRLSDGTVLRLSTEQRSVVHLMLGLFWYLLAVLAAALALSSVLAGRLSRSIVRPLNELDLDKPLANTGYEEIRPLLRRLETQQRQLRDQDRELRRKQKEFNTVTASLSEGLVLLGSAGQILSINPAAEELLRIPPQSLGRPFRQVTGCAQVTALTRLALTGRKEEQTVELPAGTYLAAVSPVRSEGAVSGVVLLLFDVTEKQRAEQLRREFTANVSHELKTPLHAISGYAELMGGGVVPQQDMAAFARKIYAETQRLIRLVEDTLRLSRLDEGAADLHWASVDLYETARSTVRACAGPAELEGVRLTLEGGPVRIPAIPQLVSAIVTNLTDNAIKYNRPGGSVTIRVDREEGGAALTVADTGIGIPREHWERIFERFYRVDKSHSKEVGGTGLGLSIVKHAALILGARLELDSTVNQGTTITVHFSDAPRERHGQ